MLNHGPIWKKNDNRGNAGLTIYTGLASSTLSIMIKINLMNN